MMDHVRDARTPNGNGLYCGGLAMRKTTLRICALLAAGLLAAGLLACGGSDSRFQDEDHARRWGLELRGFALSVHLLSEAPGCLDNPEICLLSVRNIAEGVITDSEMITDLSPRGLCQADLLAERLADIRGMAGDLAVAENLDWVGDSLVHEPFLRFVEWRDRCLDFELRSALRVQGLNDVEIASELTNLRAMGWVR